MDIVTVAKFTNLNEAKTLFRKYVKKYSKTSVCVVLADDVENIIFGMSIGLTVTKVLVIEYVNCLNCTANMVELNEKLELLTNSDFPY